MLMNKLTGLRTQYVCATELMYDPPHPGSDHKPCSEAAVDSFNTADSDSFNADTSDSFVSNVDQEIGELASRDF